MGNNIDKKILVLATMSAGKSTLINALIGYDIFPSSNEACTAKIMTYTSDESIKNIKAKISGKYNQIYDDVKKQDIALFNSNSEFNKVDFYGPINSCLNKDIKVKFIDSPGVNNSQDKTHEEITYEALEKEDFDTILYVLNATQLGVDDDALLLGKLKHYIEKNKYIDIIFALNKIDEIDTEKESLEDIYQNVIKYISKNTGIDNPQIVCTSGYYANLIKKKNRNENLTKKELRCINFFDTDYDEEYSKLNNLIQFSKFNIDTDEKHLLNKTGILNLENYLFDGINRKEMYIDLYQKLLNIKSLTDLEKYDEITLKSIVNDLNKNRVLNNEYKSFREHLENISKFNSQEANILNEVLQKYNESPIISAITKTLKYASYSANKKKLLKFTNILNEISESIEIDESISTLEILEFIIGDLKDINFKQNYEKKQSISQKASFNKEEYTMSVDIIDDINIEKDEIIRFDEKVVNIKANINIKGLLTFNKCIINIKNKTIKLLDDNSKLQINNSVINIYKAHRENISLNNKSELNINESEVNTFINTVYDKTDNSIIQSQSKLCIIALNNCSFFKYKDNFLWKN